jgi:hypothetical protein
MAAVAAAAIKLTGHVGLAGPRATPIQRTTGESVTYCGTEALIKLLAGTHFSRPKTPVECVFEVNRILENALVHHKPWRIPIRAFPPRANGLATFSHMTRCTGVRTPSLSTGPAPRKSGVYLPEFIRRNDRLHLHCCHFSLLSSQLRSISIPSPDMV